LVLVVGFLFHISFLSITTRLVQARAAELVTLPEQTYLEALFGASSNVVPV